ncbi:hypothetical protein DFH09DRAFT_1115519 [Mycena vulgaris]|nr:hypothetical protein DFH09DRAFT_1115519 [Mycena vulgaris]
MPSEWQKELTYLPAWIEAPNYLKTTFPDRDAERGPSTIYYSQEGERKELEVPEMSSWKASEDYTAPSGPWDSKRKKTAKRVSIAPGESGKEERERRNTEWERNTMMRYPRVETATGSSTSDRMRDQGVVLRTSQPSLCRYTDLPRHSRQLANSLEPSPIRQKSQLLLIKSRMRTYQNLTGTSGSSLIWIRAERLHQSDSIDYCYAGWSRQVPTHRAVLAESGLAKGDPIVLVTIEEGEVLQGALHEIHLAETNLRRLTGAGEEGDMADLRMAATLRAAEGEQTKEMLLTPLKLHMAPLYRRSILS